MTRAVKSGLSSTDLMILVFYAPEACWAHALNAELRATHSSLCLGFFVRRVRFLFFHHKFNMPGSSGPLYFQEDHVE